MKDIEPPAKVNSGWTIETAIAFLQSVIDKNKDIADARFLSQQEAVKAAFEAAALAVEKSEMRQAGINAGQNEFRGQLKDQAALFATRGEVGLEFQRISEKIESVMKEIANLKELRSADTGSKKGIETGWGFLVGAIGLVVMLIEFYLRMQK